MANTDNLEQSNNIEDRRGTPPLSDRQVRGRQNVADIVDTFNPVSAFNKIKGLAGYKDAPPSKGSLQDQAGYNSFADGGEVGDDGYDEDDTRTDTMPGMGILPTVQDTGSEYDQDQTGGQPGGGDTSPSTPGAAQSGGAQPSQLMQLVRAVHSYGMRMANQPQQQAQSFEDGGPIDDTSQDQTPPPMQGQPQEASPQPGAPQQGGPQSGLMKFLQGDRAMDPQVMAAIEHAVDPDGSMPGAARKAQAIQYAYQRGMEQTRDPREAMNMALGALQHQRKQFDMWRTAAAVKADQGDMGSSIQAANKAFEAPFGHNVHFAPVGGGQKAQGYEYGGLVRSFDPGGSTDDDENLSVDSPSPQRGGAIPGKDITPRDELSPAQDITPQDELSPAVPSSQTNTIIGGLRSAAKGIADWWNGAPPAVTATVTNDQGAPVKTIPLGKDDFRKALTTGTMSFDHFVQQGVPDTLTGTSAPMPPNVPGQPQPQRQEPQKKGVFDDIKSFDWAGRKAELTQQAHEMFPMVSQAQRAAAWVNTQLNNERMQMYKSVLPVQKVQYIQDQQNQRQGNAIASKEKEAEANRGGSMDRTVRRGDDALQRERENNDQHNKRSDAYWGNRAQEAAQREGATRRGQILKDLIAQHSPSDDLEGFKTGLKKIGLDYDRDVLNAGRGQPQGGGQPQRAPSAGGAQPQAGGQSQGQAKGGTWLPKFKAGKPVWVNDLTGEERAAQ